jgi:hypothetical protein
VRAREGVASGDAKTGALCKVEVLPAQRFRDVPHGRRCNRFSFPLYQPIRECGSSGLLRAAFQGREGALRQGSHGLSATPPAIGADTPDADLD